MYSFAVRITVIRFLELFFTSAAISSLVTVLNLLGLVTTQGMLYVWTLVGTGAFIFINVRMLRQCYADLRGGELYYICNLLAYLIFILVGIILYIIGARVLYTWLFAITKIVRFIDMGTRMRYSLLIFHSLGVLAIFLAPIKMKNIFLVDNEEWDE